MITSMTGFAVATRETEALAVDVTLRSVNHRHLDVQYRLPQVAQALEPGLRSIIQRHVSRGRLEVALTVQERSEPVPVVDIDRALVRAVAAAIDAARTGGLIEGPLRPGDVLRLPQVLKVREGRAAPDLTRIGELVDQVLVDALVSLNEMRRREGQFLALELDHRLASLLHLVDALEHASREAAETLQLRLHARVLELRLDPHADPALVAQEVVKFVARSEIREELVRLRAHMAHWVELAAGPEPCGRKLDFLLQEMNREVNTIGAKAEGTRASALVVTAKAELEKMREQVQNVE